MITKGKQLRVLLLEDSVPDAELVNDILSDLEEADRDFSVIIYHAESMQEMFEMVSEKGFGVDVAMIDLGLPDSSGIDTYRQAKRLLGEAPVVVLSGNEDEDLIRELLRHGAQDYLPKSDINHQSGRLVMRTLVFAIERAELMIELRSQQAAADLASISGVLKEACRVPCQKIGLAIKTGYDRRNKENLDRLLREAYRSTQAIAHTFEAIYAASSKPRAYDAMVVIREFVSEYHLQLTDELLEATISGCPRSLWSALEFLLENFKDDREAPIVSVQNSDESMSLEIRSGEYTARNEGEEDRFSPVTLDHATLRDLPVVYSSRLHGGECGQDHRHRALRLSIPLADSQAILDN